MSPAARSIGCQVVSALADEYPKNFVDQRHANERAQLVYASSGSMSLSTETGSFVARRQRAVWIPSNTRYEIHCLSAVSLQTIFVEPNACVTLPTTCRALEVSELLRQLIIEAVALPVEYDVHGREGRIMELILDEIATTPTAPLHVPMPRNQRLARVCRTILREPAHKDSLDDVAESVGVSRRTFTRQFRRETGMSFVAWRQHVRLLGALSRLSMGHPVTTVAFDIGYSSASAFTAMFRRTFGAAPTEYFAHSAEARGTSRREAAP